MAQNDDLKQDKTKKRTSLQNRSIHLFMTLLAKELNESGYDMKAVLKPSVDISWTKENIKEYIWKPVQHALKLKKSTTDLTTAEVSQVWEHINRHFGEKFGIHVKFPSIEQTKEYIKSYDK